MVGHGFWSLAEDIKVSLSLKYVHVESAAPGSTLSVVIWKYQLEKGAGGSVLLYNPLGH